MKKSRTHWENQKESALASMTILWPQVTAVRTKLNDLQNEHDRHQARLYEAERHLVEVTILKPTKSAKVRNTHWMKKIQSLTPRERKELARKLEGRTLEPSAG